MDKGFLLSTKFVLKLKSNGVAILIIMDKGFLHKKVEKNLSSYGDKVAILIIMDKGFLQEELAILYQAPCKVAILIIMDKGFLLVYRFYSF